MKEVITEKAKTIIIIHIQTHNNKKVIIKVNWLEEKSKKNSQKMQENYKSCLNKIKMLLNCPPPSSSTSPEFPKTNENS